MYDNVYSKIYFKVLQKYYIIVLYTIIYIRHNKLLFIVIKYMYIHLLYTDPYKWFLQTPKVMWSIMVKIFAHISEKNILNKSKQQKKPSNLRSALHFRY